MLLPLASLLNGLGYVFIVRIDEARADPDGLAGLQSIWMILGVGAFVATLIVVRDVRKLERYRYTAGFVGIVLLLLPLLPVVGRTINGSKIWVSIGPVNFQPGEFAKLALAVFFAGYLVEKRELLAINRAYRTVLAARPQAPRPRAPGLGRRPGGHGVGDATSGSSLLFFTLFLVLIWVATERVSYLAVGVALFAGGAAFAFNAFGHVQERVDIWFDPWGKDQGFQVVQAAFAMADGGVVGHGPRARLPDQDPGGRERHDLRRHRRGAGPARSHRGAHRVPADDRRRPAHRPAGGTAASSGCWPPA